MSVAKIKAAASEQKGVYVEVRAADLAAALKESNDSGDLANHVNDRLAKNPDAVMQVHRDVHLGKLLGVAKPKLET